MQRNEKYWFDKYRELGALWVHDGNMLRPHVLLTSGAHSNGFFNSSLVFEIPAVAERAAADLVRLFADFRFPTIWPDRVVGPAMGAITLAHEIARQIEIREASPCTMSFAEKVNDGADMAFTRTGPKFGERVLCVEDVLTTGGSVRKMVRAVEEAGGQVMPYILVLVNRSGEVSVDGRKIVPLIERHMPSFAPGPCPLCQGGSEAIRPKGADNWTRLNANYD